MSTVTNSRRAAHDHFEPEEAKDPKAQRALRGHLEQIDYLAYSANRTVLGATLSSVDTQKFERLALATAQARARWIATGAALTTPSPEQVEQLTALRTVYEELAAVYEAMRRLVERGYIEF